MVYLHYTQELEAPELLGMSFLAPASGLQERGKVVLHLRPRGPPVKLLLAIQQAARLPAPTTASARERDVIGHEVMVRRAQALSAGVRANAHGSNAKVDGLAGVGAILESVRAHARCKQKFSKSKS